jgi:hypothetical protein
VIGSGRIQVLVTPEHPIMSDEFPPKDQPQDPTQGKTIADAAKGEGDTQSTKPVNDRNPSPKAPLARDPSGQRPANG